MTKVTNLCLGWDPIAIHAYWRCPRVIFHKLTAKRIQHQDLVNLYIQVNSYILYWEQTHLGNGTKENNKSIPVGRYHLLYEWESFQFWCLYNMRGEHFPYSHHWNQFKIINGVTFKDQDKNTIHIRGTHPFGWMKLIFRQPDKSTQLLSHKRIGMYVLPPDDRYTT